ncbi:SIS domain-containing protein [Candidatus Hydrogenedentota bacterium]
MNRTMTLERARQILEIEAEAIKEVCGQLNGFFEEAVQMILACEGRVIVSGMGKAGIIGQKISATMASTGTPSMSLHPAEAIHGDLGTVTSKDIILAISNSGETEEVLRMVPTIKKIGAKLIAMTGDPESSLAGHADCIIKVGVSREACSMNLAPTASTTAMLAAGDALSIVLFELRGFSAEDYAAFHPGGSLGRQLVKVSDVMRSGEEHIVVNGNLTVSEVLDEITRVGRGPTHITDADGNVYRNKSVKDRDAGAACVVDEEGKLIGIFTDGDLRRSLRGCGVSLMDMPISEVMTANPLSIEAERLAAEAVRIVKNHKIIDLPVVDSEGRPIGIFNEKDVMSV